VETFDPSRQRTTESTSTHISARTVGDAWVQIGARVLAAGTKSVYDGLAMRELILATLSVVSPSSADALIDRHADPDRRAWMYANFTNRQRVTELGDAESYATRLHDYAGSGRDQLQWVVERLRADPTSRSATITTFQPLSDASYIPCISLLDFFILDGSLQLVVYAHSVDFGSKGYGNLVELARVQEGVARTLDVAVGALTLIVKSAHVYDTDADYMRGVVQALAVDGPNGA